jgi:predicted molibdopterin-dependent oxidoreductase YjgC
MSSDPLFRSLERPTDTVVIEFDGVALQVPATLSLAAALIAAGIRQTRTTPVSSAPRTAFCMMGVCFDCLVEIEGVSRQACQVMVYPGLEVRSHHAGNHHAGNIEERSDD